MIRPKWWNPKIRPIPFCIALFVFHAVLKEILARNDVVSSVFAAGGHVPAWMLFCAVAFAAVRLATFLFIPAMLAWTAAVKTIERK